MAIKESVVLNMQGEEQIAKMSEIHHFNATELDHLKILRQGTNDEKMLKTFRDLRTQLFEQSGGANFNCMITCVAPGGGATHVCRNLAAAIALDRTKTSVIVDCNFYSPTAEALLSAEINVGLSDYLNSKDMGLEYIVYASGIPRVRVIPAGNNARASAERVSTFRMNQFLDEIKSRYPDRFILIDSPSISEYPADARMLAQAVDFVILVVPYGMVTPAEVQTAIKAIGNERLAGVVFNKV